MDGALREGVPPFTNCGFVLTLGPLLTFLLQVFVFPDQGGCGGLFSSRQGVRLHRNQENKRQHWAAGRPHATKAARGPAALWTFQTCVPFLHRAVSMHTCTSRVRHFCSTSCVYLHWRAQSQRAVPQRVCRYPNTVRCVRYVLHMVRRRSCVCMLVERLESHSLLYLCRRDAQLRYTCVVVGNGKAS